MGKQKERKKSGKLAWLLMFTGILLLIAGISLGNSLIMKVKEINGEHSLNKVAVSVKNQLDSQGLNAFNLKDISDLSGKLNTEDMTFTTNPATSGTSVANGSVAAQAKVTGTNYRYPEFTQLNIKYGSFFTGKAEVDGDSVAVIEDTLAWNLFKTENVVGRKVHIYQTDFKIVGVIKKGVSILQTLTDDGVSEVYIPAARLLELDTSSRITCLQIKTEGSGLPGQEESSVTSALQYIGKNADNYNITNFLTKDVLLSQMPMLVQFVLGLATIFMLIGFFIKTTKTLYLFIEEECLENDLRAVIGGNLKRIGTDIFKLLFISAVITVLWLIIRFKPYIPANCIPDNLIDIQYYTNLIKSSIGEKISGMGYILPNVELTMNVVEILAALVIFIPAFLSLILLYSGFISIKQLDPGPYKLTLLCAFMVIFSIMLTVGAAWLLGLPAVLQIKSVLIPWTFIYIITFKIYDGKECEQRNA